MKEARFGRRIWERGAGYAVGAGALAAGSLDITYAFLVSAMAGVPPLIVGQYIASGLIGPTAFTGGLPTAAAGLLLHFLMALLIAVIFFLASRKLLMLVERPLTWGIFYGLTVYVVMNYVVLPLSNVPGGPRVPDLPRLLGDLTIHAFGVGLPISLAVRRYAHASNNPSGGGGIVR